MKIKRVFFCGPCMSREFPVLDQCPPILMCMHMCRTGLIGFFSRLSDLATITSPDDTGIWHPWTRLSGGGLWGCGPIGRGW